MDRADLLAYLSAALGDLLTECGISATDDPAGLQYPLDQTYERIGTETPGDLAYMSVGEYYTLTWCLNVLTSRVDFDATAHQNSKQSVLFNQVSKRLELAETNATAAGFPVGGEVEVAPTFTAPDFYLDFVEPY